MFASYRTFYRAKKRRIMQGRYSLGSRSDVSPHLVAIANIFVFSPSSIKELSRAHSCFGRQETGEAAGHFIHADGLE